MNKFDPKLEQRLKRARTLLVLDQPFFGVLALKLECEPADWCETACTDGNKIYWNPEFAESLSDEELRGVLAHEVMHLAMGHLWRVGSRDMDTFNIAADMAINDVLKNSGFKLPKDAFYPPAGDEGHSAEYYDKLPKNPQGGGKGGLKGGKGGQGQGPGGQSGRDPGKCGSFIKPGDKNPGTGKALTPQQVKQLRQDWEINIAQAETAAKSQGKMPADLARLVDEILNPKVSWAVVLRDFVERTARNDYNWNVPNRRFLQRGVVLPTLISDELPEIVIAIDTSGSIGKKELDQFCTEVSDVLSAYETTIRLVYCDAAVAHTQTVTRADLPLKLEPRGGGGTDFRPVFSWVDREGLTPACLIYLTDLYGDFPKTEPDYPVLWVATTNQKAPMGQTITMN